jgi:hypothetical protein
MKNTNATISDYPEIGGGVTICYWSDCEPATIIAISRTGHKITIQEDSSKRLDKNGISECQEYEYATNPEGTVHTASLRSDGTYRLASSKTRVSLKGRRKFHDFSF